MVESNQKPRTMWQKGPKNPEAWLSRTKWWKQSKTSRSNYQRRPSSEFCLEEPPDRNEPKIQNHSTDKEWDRKDPKNPELCDRKDTQSQNQVNKNLQKHPDVIIREILETQSNVYPELSDGKHPEVIIREEPETQNYVSERQVSEKKEFPEPENTWTDWCEASDGIHDDQTSSPRAQALLQILLTVLLPASSSQLHLLHILSNLIPHLSLLITPENNTMEWRLQTFHMIVPLQRHPAEHFSQYSVPVLKVSKLTSVHESCTKSSVMFRSRFSDGKIPHLHCVSHEVH